MARDSHGPLALLLSIKPRFARAIMAGTKTVEFRKVRHRTDVKAVLVYATSPVQRLIGYFDVTFVDESTPRALWRRYGRVGGIEQDEFFRYYAGADRAVAIGVGNVHRLATEQPLNRLGRKTVPPQSSKYVPLAALNTLRSG